MESFGSPNFYSGEPAAPRLYRSTKPPFYKKEALHHGCEWKKTSAEVETPPSLPQTKTRIPEAAPLGTPGTGLGGRASPAGTAVSGRASSLHGGVLRRGDLPLPAGCGDMAAPAWKTAPGFSGGRLGCHDHRLVAGTEMPLAEIPAGMARRAGGAAMLKREVNLTGRPLQPILRGRPAVIREPTGCRRTTPVLWVEQLSSREIIFETQTQYTACGWYLQRRRPNGHESNGTTAHPGALAGRQHPYSRGIPSRRLSLHQPVPAPDGHPEELICFVEFNREKERAKKSISACTERARKIPPITPLMREVSPCHDRTTVSQPKTLLGGSQPADSRPVGIPAGPASLLPGVSRGPGLLGPGQRHGFHPDRGGAAAPRHRCRPGRVAGKPVSR